MIKKKTRTETRKLPSYLAFSSKEGVMATARPVRNAIYKRDRDQSIPVKLDFTFCMKKETSITSRDSQAAR